MDPKLAAILAILQAVTDPSAAIEAINSYIAATSDGDGAGDLPAEDGAPIAATGDAPPPGAAPPVATTRATSGATGPGAPPPPAPAAPVPVGTPIAPNQPALPPTPGAPFGPVQTPAAPVPPGTPPGPAAASTAASVDEISRHTASAVRAVNDAQRDLLLQTQGDRLEPAVLRWAATQPLDTVRGLLGAAPARLDAPTRIAATRGASQGSVKAAGLQGAELEEFNEAMGIVKVRASAPYSTPEGLVLPTVTPTEYRRHKATAAAAAGKGV